MEVTMACNVFHGSNDEIQHFPWKLQCNATFSMEVMMACRKTPTITGKMTMGMQYSKYVCFVKCKRQYYYIWMQ